MPTLERDKVACPHADCPSSSGAADPHVIKHSRYRAGGKLRQRRLCRVCKRTFSATTGTCYERMRKPKSSMDRAVTMSAEGMTKAAIGRCLGTPASTVARWLIKTAEHVRAFHDQHVVLEDAGEIQLDEVSSRGVGGAKNAWAFSGVEVESRMWLGVFVGTRTLGNTKLFVRSVRDTLGPTAQWILVGTDKFQYYSPALKDVFGGDPIVYHQIHNTYARGRVVRSESKLVMGSPEAYAEVRERESDSNRPNTSFIERMNLNKRMSCSMLRRRTPAPARSCESLQGALELVRVFYNFVRIHSSLRSLSGPQTPAMAAGIMDRPLRIREILGWVVPGGRRRRRTLQAVLDRC